MTKIVIYVDGGNVQAVYTNGNPQAHEIVLIDFDNLKAEQMTSADCERVLISVTKGMTAIY